MTAQPLVRPGEPVEPAPRRSPATSTYTELAATIRQSGLMRRRYGYYWTWIVGLVAGFAGLVAGMVWLGDSWWQLLLAAALGVLVTQFGFLGHDAAHRQIFVSSAWNDWTARDPVGGVRRAELRLVARQAQPAPRPAQPGGPGPRHRPRRPGLHP